MRARRNWPRRLLAGLATVCGPALAGCEFDTTAISPPGGRVVVHSVLNPGFSQQLLLLERTLTGRVPLSSGEFDPNSPIVSGGGVPISKAQVVLRSETGAKWTATEAQGGVYVFTTGLGGTLGLGRRYTLEVKTTEGEVVTAQTLIPNVAPRQGLPLRPFDRENDTLFLKWPEAPGARTYALRIDTPTGPFMLFVDSQSIRLPGTLRNLFAIGLPRVFSPGFRQLVTVSAVDVNYFDYYRSRNDTFTGSGLISSIAGGTGFFGAAVNVHIQQFDVYAPYRVFPEGEYARVRGSGPARMQLWVETPADGGRPAVVTGRYIVSANSEPNGFYGSLSGNDVAVTLLRGPLVTDTLTRFIGQVRDDSLVGRFGANEPSAYRRLP